MCIMAVKLCRSQVQFLTLDWLLWTLHGLYVLDMGVWRLQWDSFSWALGLRNWDFGVAFFFFFCVVNTRSLRGLPFREDVVALKRAGVVFCLYKGRQMSSFPLDSVILPRNTSFRRAEVLHQGISLVFAGAGPLIAVVW